MTTEVLAPTPVFRAFDNNNNPLVAGKLFTYQAGTTTKLASYSDSTGLSANTNPVILNARGEANVWIPSNVAYKFVLSPATDTDPPTNPFWTVDQIVNSQLITLYGGVDTGAANAYVLTFTANFNSLADGIVIYWIPAHANTGPSTINVNGYGVVNIVRQDGTPLAAGNILANQVAVIMYKGGQFLLVSSGNVYPALYGGTSTGPANTYALTYAAQYGQYSNGIIIYWLPNATNTGASTLNVNGLGALPIVYPNGSALNGGELSSGLMATVVLQGLQWVLLTSGALSFQSGTWTPGWTGFSAPPTGNVYWQKIGNLAVLSFGINNTGTSNANTFTMTGLPSNLQPSTGGGARVPVLVIDNGNVSMGAVAFGLAGSVTLYIGTAPPNSSGFTASGTKGFAFGTAIVYPVV
jgi:hypothetical protein